MHVTEKAGFVIVGSAVVTVGAYIVPKLVGEPMPVFGDGANSVIGRSS